MPRYSLTEYGAWCSCSIFGVSGYSVLKMSVEITWVHLVMAVIASMILIFVIHASIKIWREKHPPQSIEHWQGSGVNTSLDEAEAALLMGLGPEAIFSIAVIKLILDNKLAVTDYENGLVAVTKFCSGGSENPENTLLRIVKQLGHIRGKEYFEYLEKLYESVNRKMLGYSGGKTVLHYRDILEAVWKDAYDRGTVDFNKAVWMVMGVTAERYKSLGSTSESELLKEMVNFYWRISDGVFKPREISDAVGRAKSGYFSWRKDLYSVQRELDTFYWSDWARENSHNSDLHMWFWGGKERWFGKNDDKNE